MGVGVRSSSSYRLRTIWTPEMDQYFIGLMLEQVCKGNRIDDHLFSKRAWKHMTALFNTKFNSQYKKDVLKNRHKTLRNLYRALKNILEQKGFRWDESRQMVAADKDVWDDYIKAHPDARVYRVKAIPYYSDLCEIYKNVGFGGKGTSSRQNANYNGNMSQSDISRLEGEKYIYISVDDYQKKHCDFVKYSLNLGEDTVISDIASESLHDITVNEDYGIGTRTRIYWQPPMDLYFIDLMLDQVKKGNQVNGLFRKQAWKEMISYFNSKFGFNYEVDILKNRYKSLRRQHNVMKNHLELDGFSWDEARHMVIADDCVWQDYIKAHTDIRQYMTKPVPYFEDLCIICRDLNSDDQESISSHQINLAEILDEDPKIKYAAINQSPAAASVSSHNQMMTKCQLGIPQMTESSKKSRTEDENTNNVAAIEEVVVAIQALPDMDEDSVLDACDFLEDEKRAKTFLALDLKLRKKWLMRKLRPL